MFFFFNLYASPKNYCPYVPVFVLWHVAVSLDMVVRHICVVFFVVPHGISC